MKEKESTATSNRVDASCPHRLVIVSIFSTLATLLVATFYPSGKPADDLMSLSFTATYFWIAGQSFVLSLPGLTLGCLLGLFTPRLGAVLGTCLMLAVPVVVLCDAMTFNWIAERFLSGTMTRIVTSLLPALALHVTPAAIIQGSLLGCAVLIFGFLVWKFSGTIAIRWQAKRDAVQPIAFMVVLSVVAGITSFSALRSLSRTTAEMEQSSTRHPFCAFHIVGYRGVGVPVPVNQAAVLPRLRGLQAIDHVHARERGQFAMKVDKDQLNEDLPAPGLRKVIIVVVECLRPEIIDPAVMPNLHAFAEESIYCANHFASGNATCYSMFSLVNGLETVWFRRDIAKEPIMNRLLHQAGYQLGFYGGQTDWAQYHMDGFINPTQYEDFEIEEPDLPGSDIRAIERTLDFLDQQQSAASINGSEKRREGGVLRAAMCYLYATHSRFRYSDPNDRIFLPEASESVLMSRAPELRDQFYNRYKNSLRTMDRMLAPLLRKDCVVLVMGDHGEPFLDDGTAIHGTRLSRYQNMTPALIYYPGVQPRLVTSPTSHADFLPTLLSILEIPVTDSTVFDGADLTTAQYSELSQRSFVTGNFMDSTVMLVGPWTDVATEPFGYRCSFDLFDWQASYLNPIDERGYQWEEESSAAIHAEGKKEYQKWAASRFGEASIDERLTSRELFEKFLRSDDGETRFSALKIAGSLADPDDYLYDLIARATRDPIAEIRTYAKDLIIRISRYQGRSQ